MMGLRGVPRTPFSPTRTQGMGRTVGQQRYDGTEGDGKDCGTATV